MTIFVKDLISKKSSKASSDLLTRPVGKKYYQSAEKKISSAMNGEVVILDFADIKVIDPSFADEFVINIVKLSHSKDFYVRLRNLTKSAQSNISAIIDSYTDFAKKDYAVAVEDLLDNGTHFLGNIGLQEKEIAEFLRINKTASTKAISDNFSFTESKTVNCLKTLEKLRIVRTDETGKYFSVL